MLLLTAQAMVVDHLHRARDGTTHRAQGALDDKDTSCDLLSLCLYVRQSGTVMDDGASRGTTLSIFAGATHADGLDLSGHSGNVSANVVLWSTTVVCDTNVPNFVFCYFSLLRTWAQYHE